MARPRLYFTQARRLRRLVVQARRRVGRTYRRVRRHFQWTRGQTTAVVLGIVLVAVSWSKVEGAISVEQPAGITTAPGLTITPAEVMYGENTHHWTYVHVSTRGCGEPVDVAAEFVFPHDYGDDVVVGVEGHDEVVVSIDDRSVDNVRAWFDVGSASDPTISLGPPESLDEQHWFKLRADVRLSHVGPQLEEEITADGVLIHLYPYAIDDGRYLSPEFGEGATFLLKFSADWTRPRSNGSCYVLLPAVSGEGVDAAVTLAISALENGGVLGADGGSNTLSGRGVVDLDQSIPPPDDIRRLRWSCSTPHVGTGREYSDPNASCEAVAVFHEPNAEEIKERSTVLWGALLGAGVAMIIGAAIGVIRDRNRP